VRLVAVRVPAAMNASTGTGVVRPARPDDWPAVAGLLVELRRGVTEASGGDPTHRMQFAGHIRRLDVVTIVAERDALVVGVLDMEYHQRLGDHRPQARLNDLVVAGDVRRSGVGRALLATAEELARKRGCFRMALVTAGWRDDAQAFYGREGWTPYGRWFVKALADDIAPSGEPVGSAAGDPAADGVARDTRA
jgi:GNAT superfamily N-acetyltransferase